MKHFLIALSALSILALAPAVASAQTDHPVSKATIVFSQPVIIGTQTVPAGEYRFECRVVDGQHTMIVTSRATGKEVARLKCTPVSLDTIVELTQYRSAKAADGTLVVTEVRIHGEKVGHRIVEG